MTSGFLLYTCISSNQTNSTAWNPNYLQRAPPRANHHCCGPLLPPFFAKFSSLNITGRSLYKNRATARSMILHLRSNCQNTEFDLTITPGLASQPHRPNSNSEAQQTAVRWQVMNIARPRRAPFLGHWPIAVPAGRYTPME